MKFVAVLEDHDIIGYAFKTLIQEVSNEQVYFEEVDSEHDLLMFIARFPKCCVIINYQLLHRDIGVKKFIEWKKLYPLVSWTILLQEDLHEVNRNFLISDLATISVLFTKDNLRTLKGGLRLILSGEVYQTAEVKKAFNSTLNNVERIEEHLTKVEREILKEIALGKMTKEIAFERNISVHTVVTHRKNIFKKIEVNNVHDAMRFAIRAGIVSVSEYII